MSVLWGTLQAKSEVDAQNIMKWLVEESIQTPPNFSIGRIATPNELKFALCNLKDAEVSYNVGQTSEGKHNWQATVKFDGKHILISSIDYSGDEDQPVQFYYQGDLDLITLLLRRLAVICGDFILYTGIRFGKWIFIQPELNV